MIGGQKISSGARNGWVSGRAAGRREHVTCSSLPHIEGQRLVKLCPHKGVLLEKDTRADSFRFSRPADDDPPKATTARVWRSERPRPQQGHRRVAWSGRRGEPGRPNGRPFARSHPWWYDIPIT